MSWMIASAAAVGVMALSAPWLLRDAANGPLALAATKRILAEQFSWEESEFWARQGEISGAVFTSEDAREGATAFAEKRPPVWKGR